MQFHNWQTLTDEAGQIHGKEWKKMSIPRQVHDELQALLDFPFKNEATRTRRVVRLGVETGWMMAGRPYYNIHPMMAAKLGKTNLDKIPARFIEIPGGFSAINIRFSDDIPIRILPANQPFHLGVGSPTKTAPVGFRSVLFGKFNFDQDELLRQFAPDMIGQDQYVLAVDEGCRCIPEAQRPVQRMLCNTIIFGVKPDETVPQAIERATNEVAGSVEEMMLVALRERLENLFRIIITTGFLADCPEDMLVVPDVLADDRWKYWDALQKGLTDDAKRIAARAKRRGKFGWNVGTNEMFVGQRPLPNTKTNGDSGRELSYSHIREGHPHAVRFGPGKTLVKIKWFRPTRVRPDLPFKAE